MQRGQRRQRREIGDLRIGAIQRLQRGQRRQRREIGDRCGGASERLQRGQRRQRREVGDRHAGNGQNFEVQQDGEPVKLSPDGVIRPIRAFVPRPVLQGDRPAEVQLPQVPKPEQVRRQFGQPQVPQIEESRPPLGLFGDALACDSRSIEVL